MRRVLGHEMGAQMGQIETGLAGSQFFLDRQQIGLRRHARGNDLRARAPDAPAGDPRGAGRLRSFPRIFLRLRLSREDRRTKCAENRLVLGVVQIRFGLLHADARKCPDGTSSGDPLSSILSQFDALIVGRRTELPAELSGRVFGRTEREDRP